MTLLTRPAGSYYTTVAAGETYEVAGLGITLTRVLVVPATTSPGGVVIADGATSITVFAGGASSVDFLKPIYIPLCLRSVIGVWKVTAGANVSVIVTAQGGAAELPDAPSGFAYLVDGAGAYIINGDDAYILAKV